MGLVLAEITLDIEERFGIQIPDATAYNTQTAGDLHEVVLERLREENRLAEFFRTQPPSDDRLPPTFWSCDQVWTALCEIIHQTGDVPFERITREARLMEDLGLD